MNRPNFATNALTLSCLTFMLITNGHAATSTNKVETNKVETNKVTTNKVTTSKVEVESDNGQGTSQEEIATLDVLNEICPKIIGTNNNKNYSKGYRNLMTHMLPSIKDPVAAVNAMHTDPDYMKIYDNARISALKEKVDDNRDVCLEVLHYKASKK
jgi:hypothetical protein